MDANAAARLNIAQSYLSREVKKFENEQGYLFFQRNKRGVAAITGAGQAFIREIQPVLDNLRTGFERASEVGRLISRQKAGSLLIGYSPLVTSGAMNVNDPQRLVYLMPGLLMM